MLILIISMSLRTRLRVHLFLLARARAKAKARPQARTNGGGTITGISDEMMDGTMAGEETILGSFQFGFTSVPRGVALNQFLSRTR